MERQREVCDGAVLTDGWLGLRDLRVVGEAAALTRQDTAGARENRCGVRGDDLGGRGRKVLAVGTRGMLDTHFCCCWHV